jgi:hypothetical protein
MDKELIAGLFTIVGAIIGGLLSKYGVPSFRYQKIIKCSGSAKDINLSSIMPELEDNSLYTYDVPDCEIKKSKTSVSVHCHLIAHKNGQSVPWTLKGNGPLLDGVAYCNYETQLLDRSVSWKGVLALSFSSGGRIVGFWITENTSTRGKMAFGVLELIVK